MYDFHKIKSKECNNCFSHPLFRRGSKHLIKEIKRKVGNIEEQTKTETQKNNNSVDLLSTIQELNKRLAKLEAREKSYEDLLKDYKEMKEKNMQLESHIKYFTQTMSDNCMQLINTSQSKNGTSSNNPFGSNSLYNNSPLNGYFGYYLPNKPLSPVGLNPPDDFMIIEAPSKSLIEEVKEDVGMTYKRNMQQRPYEGDTPIISPKIIRSQPSPGISPAILAFPFNPAVDDNTEREPSYLKEMELSPLRYWTRVGDGKRVNADIKLEVNAMNKDKKIQEAINTKKLVSTYNETGFEQNKG
jgi:hypothetical protein